MSKQEVSYKSKQPKIKNIFSYTYCCLSKIIAYLYFIIGAVVLAEGGLNAYTKLIDELRKVESLEYLLDVKLNDKNLVLRSVCVSVLPIDLQRVTPFGRPVLLPSAIVPIRRQINTNGEPVEQEQNEDSFQAVLTKLNMKRMTHHLAEVFYDPN